MQVFCVFPQEIFIDLIVHVLVYTAWSAALVLVKAGMEPKTVAKLHLNLETVSGRLDIQ